MLKKIMFAGVAMLVAGLAQAEAPQGKEREARTTIAQKDATKSTRSQGATNENTHAAQASEPLHPDARPVYLNGGHFGD